MKSNAKSKIIILSALGSLFAFSLMITVNLSFITGNNNKSSKFNDDINLDKENLKISAISGKIRIINNSGWVAFENAGNCTGDGTYSDPYVIEDLVIDANNTGSCILIENSTVYFRIENCTLYNSRDYAGIKLNNTTNSQIIDNNCSSNYYGIYIYNGENNTVSGNTVNDNNYGIYLSYSNINTISGNTVNNNMWYGINLRISNNNTVSGNTLELSEIIIHGSDYNTVLGNTVNNNDGSGIILTSGNFNTLSGNTANNNDGYGISLVLCYFTTVSGNTANNNGVSGIFLKYGGSNIISGNTANNNKYGIYLWKSDYNTVRGNTFLGNDECIKEVDCRDNIFENNDCGIIFLILIISGVAIVGIVTILLIKHIRKRIQFQKNFEN
jgi:parallel beta-helix repeat protein